MEKSKITQVKELAGTEDGHAAMRLLTGDTLWAEEQLPFTNENNVGVSIDQADEKVVVSIKVGTETHSVALQKDAARALLPLLRIANETVFGQVYPEPMEEPKE